MLSFLYLPQGEEMGTPPEVGSREKDVILLREGDVVDRLILGPPRPWLSWVATSLPSARARTVVRAEEPESRKTGREQGAENREEEI
jgi:hypothetical protein